MSKLPEDVDALVRLSLEIGLEKFCERVIEAHSQRAEEGRKLKGTMNNCKDRQHRRTS